MKNPETPNVRCSMRGIVLGGVVCMVLVLCGVNAFGADNVWTGNVDGNWATAGNWTDGTPNSGSKVKLDDSPGGTAITIILNANGTVKKLKFDADNIEYTISGSGTLTIGDDAKVESQGDANVIFNANIDMANDTKFNVTGAGTLTINGVISGNKKLKAEGTGTLILSGANTFSNDLEIKNGTVLLGNNSAAGTKKLKLNGGDIGTTGGSVTISLPVEVKKSFSVTAGDLTLSGEMTLKDASKTITVNSGASATISGKIIDDGGSDALVKAGTGSLLLSNGANAYAAGTTVNAGTLSVSESGSITLGSSDGGNNYLGTGSVTVNDGGSLSLISSGGSININGTLDINGSSGSVALSSSGGTIVNGTLTIEVGRNVDVTSGGITFGAGSTTTMDGGINVTGDATLTGGA